MELLPELPLDQLLMYLDESDLLACSLVSVGWRAAVNNDRVWRKTCYKVCNAITIDYVQTVNSKISPAFEEPVFQQTRLDSLCYWRIVYMKLQHVKRNWQKGHHETNSVTNFAYNHFDLKIDNDLLVGNVNDNQCEVWNIRGSVPVRQETIECALKNTRCKCMINLCENRLVIVQDTMLQVYSRDENKFSLQHRRLFNQPQVDSDNIPGSSNVDEWYNETVTQRPSHLQAFNVGKYFIGLAQNGPFHSSSFHVWDTSTGNKLKEEISRNISPECVDTIYNVKFCPPKTGKDKLLICIQRLRQTAVLSEDSYFTILYIYDLPTLTIKKLKVLQPHVPWLYYMDKFILTLDHTQAKLSFFDSSNGVMITTKKYEDIINPDSIQTHRDYLGFTTGGHLVVLNVKDFELIFATVIVKFSSSLFGFDFVFLDWNLILISRWDEVNKIEVWSMKKKSFVSTLHTNGLMFPCNNSAKFFVWNEMITTIYMLQFW